MPVRAPINCFWVCHGIVKVSAPTLEGGERLLHIFEPGDIFGMSWLKPDQRRVSMAQALSPSGRGGR